MNPPLDTSAAGAKAGFWVTFLAALGCFVIFLVVLFLAYIPQRRLAPEVDLSKVPPEEQWMFPICIHNDILDLFFLRLLIPQRHISY